MDDLRARSRYVAARSLPLLLLLAVAACGGGEEAAEDAAPAEDAAAATGALPLPAAGDSAAATAAEPDTTAFAAAPDETARAAGPDAGAEARTVAEPEPEPATERAPEEPPAPRPVAEAATAPGGEYSLQVGSFSRAANAEALRDRLAELGHTAVVETAFVDGRTWHRVVLPGFDDRTTALQIGEALHRRLDIEYLVRRQP